MSKAKRYTLETLLPLNVSYDSDHGLTQEDVDLVNSLVEVIESTRSKHTPKIGDRVVYTQKGGEYHPHGLIEMELKNDVRIRLDKARKDGYGFRLRLDNERSEYDCSIKHVYGVCDTFFGKQVSIVSAN